MYPPRDGEAHLRKRSGLFAYTVRTVSTSDLSLQAMSDDDVLVAWRNDGEDLTAEQLGWPW